MLTKEKIVIQIDGVAFVVELDKDLDSESRQREIRSQATRNWEMLYGRGELVHIDGNKYEYRCKYGN